MNEEDPIKNEGARVLARLYMDFSDAQEQLTPKSAVQFRRNSNSSKLLWLSLLIFFKRSRAANSAVCSRSMPNFELLRDIIVVLLTYMNVEDQIKNEGARVLTRFIYLFFRCSRAANPEVSGGIQLKFKLIQAFMVVLITCKNEKDPNKNKGSRVLTRFSPL